MFCKKVLKENLPLVETAFALKERGEILPDTYVVDLDQLLENAKGMLKLAGSDVELFFMLKQLGRNPLIARKLTELGFAGAVCVDFKDALVMMENNLPIAHLGHLVQTPKSLLAKFMSYGVKYMTVFSREKLREISHVAKTLNITQKVILRSTLEGEMIYSGQECGFSENEIEEIYQNAKSYENVEIVGLTSFPCFLYSEKTGKIEKTVNLKNLLDLREKLEKQGVKVLLNTPSATSAENLPEFKALSLNMGEPGHSLTGTMPLPDDYEGVEKIAYVYVTEVSHNFNGKGMLYGGGLYRRGHLAHGIIKKDGNYKLISVSPVRDDSIDYHFIAGECLKVSSTVVMSMRTQIFVTRSDVAVVSGIKSGKITVEMFNSQGDKK